MDEFTERHLRSWLTYDYPDDERRENAFRAMREIYSGEPEYWSREGWGRVREVARLAYPEAFGAY